MQEQKEIFDIKNEHFSMLIAISISDKCQTPERRQEKHGRKINREIRDYTESMFFGLSLRQFFFSVLACGAAVLIYLHRSTSQDI